MQHSGRFTIERHIRANGTLCHLRPRSAHQDVAEFRSPEKKRIAHWGLLWLDPRMADLSPLAGALPPTGIETQAMGQITGFNASRVISIYQPPAGQKEAYLDVREALTDIVSWAGHSSEQAAHLAATGESAIVATLPPLQRPWCLDDMGRDMRCAPASAVAAWLCRLGEREALAADFLSRSASIAVHLPVFGCGEFVNCPRSLHELPHEPLVSGWTEFFCGLESEIIWRVAPEDDGSAAAKAAEWKGSTRPRIEALSDKVGTKLFHFADPSDEFDDDLAHRFLALDYVCHMIPRSPFVSWLCEVTGAASVTELREAFYDPDAYSPDFSLHGGDSVEAFNWPRFEYGQLAKRTIAIVTSTAETRRIAEGLALTRLDGDLHLVPYDQDGSEPLRRAADRAGAAWRLYSPLGDWSPADDFELLARIDELWAVKRSISHVDDLGVPERRQLQLLTRAEALGVPVTWWDSSGFRALSLQGYQSAQIEEALALTKEQARSATDELRLLRVWPEWGSSGIWSLDEACQAAAGRMVPYAMLDVPFALIRRIAKWQQAFDEGKPEFERSQEAGAWLRAEQRELAVALQAALGPNHVVECGHF